MLLPHYTLRTPTPADADACYAIETSAYEGDEAATLEKIALRIRQYPAGFMLLEIDGRIAGFINSGCADQVELSDTAFKELVGHHPDGRHVVIMSVVVHPDFQGQGLAAILLQNFILRMRRLGKHSILLVCRQQHIALYERFGFGYVQPSESAYGGHAWHEMVLQLRG